MASYDFPWYTNLKVEIAKTIANGARMSVFSNFCLFQKQSSKTANNRNPPKTV